MTSEGFALFDTTMGRCAIAWGEGGLVGVGLLFAGSSAPGRARSYANPLGRVLALCKGWLL